ncbi:prephenate dehydrogenase [Lachnospiraceae bacterium ZAX-1]
MIPAKIGFIGLGLIGGTLAKTVHRIYPELQIVAYDTDAKALNEPLLEKVITKACTKIDDSFSDCQYIFLCAPVKKNTAILQTLSIYANASCILTDVGSVKGSVHREIDRLSLNAYFIGGHPMAGSEKSGYANATAFLLENVYYIVTPGKEVPCQTVATFVDFISSLGAIPLLLDYAEHDFMTAAVSHLPHILAASLVNLIQELDNSEETMKAIAAGGFKDITRIASSSPAMWQEICLTNQEQILKLLNAFIASLSRIKEEISEKKETDIFSFFQSAKDYRDSIAVGKTGPILAVYELYCDLIDEAGGIATLATILASNRINIKNIGILHNREFEEGVLRIELYDKDALQRSIVLLRKYRYIVYER